MIPISQQAHAANLVANHSANSKAWPCENAEENTETNKTLTEKLKRIKRRQKTELK